jgi:hypothetical protein
MMRNIFCQVFYFALAVVDSKATTSEHAGVHTNMATNHALPVPVYRHI